MSDAHNRLAMAALDPDAAILAADEVVTLPHPKLELEPAGPVTMAIEAEVPKRWQRWRWFFAYHLIKLAARIYGFKVEFFRPPRPWE